MEFWNNSSTGVRVAIVAALFAVACAIGAICMFAITTLTGNDATPTPPPEITVIVPTAEPNVPTLTANADVNVRSGPGLNYDVIGIIQSGRTAEVIGASADGNWWVIKFPASPNGQGWVNGEIVTAENTDNVPVIDAPPIPTPGSTATPVVITDWKGEYFDNPDVAGEPVLIRNDLDINFNFGSGPPAPGLPTNNYSIRWSRQADFDKGIYTFQVNVEGGVRLWVDGVLLIDQWRSQPYREISVDSQELSRGGHDLRIDYFKQSGNGQISVFWNQQIPAGPPVAVINGTTQAAVGEVALFNARSSSAAEGSHLESFEWDFGDRTGGSGVDVEKVYNQPGIYNVTLTVIDDKGLSDTAEHQIEIVALPSNPPVAVISAPSEELVQQNVRFDGSASSGDTPIASYSWEFGDGTTANGVVVDKVFAQAGIYNVVLTVVDGNGLSSKATHRIEIIAPDPTAGPTPDPEVELEARLWGLLNNTEITLDFEDGQFSGFAGCNSITGQYQVSGNNLSMVVVSQTQEACEAGILNQQAVYLTSLSTVNSFDISGNQLTLSGVDDLVYRGTPK